MEKSDEKRVIEFLNSHRTEIEDKGFTDRVMHQLPKKKSYWYITPLFTLLGIIIISLFLDYQSFVDELYLFIQNTPVIYLIGIYYIAFAGILLLFYHKLRELIYF